MKALEQNRKISIVSRLLPRLFVSLTAVSLVLLLLSILNEQQNIDTSSVYDAFTKYFCMKNSNISDHHDFRKFLRKQISFCYAEDGRASRSTNYSNKSDSSIQLPSNESKSFPGTSSAIFFGRSHSRTCV